MRNGRILVLMLLISSLAIMSFSAPSDWARDEINEARSKRLVVAQAARNYRDPINRELFCKLVIRMFEKASDSSIRVGVANPFEDTADSAVIKAYQYRIVNGVSENLFSPGAFISRQEVAVMIMRTFRALDNLQGTRYADDIDISGLAFEDETQIAPWALKDVKRVYRLGILKGTSGGKIEPLKQTTIEQSILLMLRVYKIYKPDPVNQPNRQSQPSELTGENDSEREYKPANKSKDKVPSKPDSRPSYTKPEPKIFKPKPTTGSAFRVVSYYTTSAAIAVKAPKKRTQWRSPVAKSGQMQINVCDEKIYVINPTDLGFDPDGDYFFVNSVEPISQVGALQTDLDVLVNESGKLVVYSNNPVNIGRTAKYKLKLTDYMSQPVTMELTIRVVKETAKPLIRFSPSILNVKSGKFDSADIYSYIDSSSPLKITNIEPATGDDFGQLVRMKQNGVDALVFKAKDKVRSENVWKAYKVTVQNRDAVTTFNLVVRYGNLPYNPNYNRVFKK